MSTSLPSYVHDLVDDAAIFPPGNAPLDEAVAAHRRHRASPHAEMVGPGRTRSAVTWASRADGVALAGVEVAMRESDAGDLAPNARRIVTAVDQLGLDVPVSVEVPRLYGDEPSASWLGALDEVAAVDHRLKLRTGGLEVDAFPSTHELATCIVAALDRVARDYGNGTMRLTTRQTVQLHGVIKSNLKTTLKANVTITD